MKEMDLIEATRILDAYYITDSFQMTARWLREGRIKGRRTENRKEGWRIEENDLYDFIESVRPGLIDVFKLVKGQNPESFHLSGTFDDKYGIPLNQEEPIIEQSYVTAGKTDKVKSVIVDLDRSFNQFKKESTKQNAALQKEIAILRDEMRKLSTKPLTNKEEVEDCNSKTNKSEEPTKIKPWSLQEFVELVKQCSNDGKIPKEIDNTKIETLHSKIFTKDGLLHEKCLEEDGAKYKCPITLRVRSFLKFESALKKAIEAYFPLPLGTENDNSPKPANESEDDDTPTISVEVSSSGDLFTIE